MIIVELIGLSGCGKTTLCKHIRNELKKNGIRTSLLQKTPAKYDSFYTKLSHFVKSKLALRNSENRIFVDEIKNAFENTGINQNASFVYWLEKMAMLNYTCLKSEKRGVKVGLVDEGCIQFITSILQKNDADSSLLTVVEALKKVLYKSRTIFVNCELEPEKCVERMLARGRVVGAFDETSYDNTINNLVIRRKNLDFLMSPLDKNSVLITKMEGDDNLTELLEVLYKKLGNQIE